MRGWNWNRISGCIFSLVLLSFSLNLYGFELEAAQIEEVQGQVLVFNEGGVSRPAHKGETVLSEEIIETKAKSKAVLLFDDGSRIQLGPNTKLKVNDAMTEGTNSVMLFLGRIFARIIPRASEEPVFAVQTLTCTAGVRGTNFEVASGMDGTEIIGVDEGEVIVSTETEESSVKKGEEAEVSNEGKLKKGKRRLRTEAEWEQWFTQREQFFIEHSEQMINNLTQHVGQARERIQNQDRELMELRKQLKAEAEQKRISYFRVRREIKPLIRSYGKMLSRLGQANNRLMAIDQIITRAEEQIKLNPEAYSEEFKNKIRSARAQLEEINVRKLYQENRRLIRGHFVMLTKIAQRFNLENELWRSLPAKTRKQILNKIKQETGHYREDSEP